jgi:uncharacterized LabA/DUF88 family protein
MEKVAVFVDWENIRQRIFQEAHKTLGKKIDYNNIDNTLQFFNAFIDTSIESIYRIFVYLAEPYGGIIGGKDYKTTPVYTAGMQFIENIQVRDYIAVRKGKLAFRGFDHKGNPIFVQKRTDMLLGLDIAHVAFHRYADRALILCFDTDIIPAMKEARINGMQVIWGWCPDLQSLPDDDLRKHADFIRSKAFASIFP